MDTDDLSIPTCNGIILEAEKFNHDLTLQFGVLAADCLDDDDYLNQAESLIKEWLATNDMFNLIDTIFFGISVNEKEFKKIVNKILFNITEIRKISLENREFENWA